LQGYGVEGDDEMLTLHSLEITLAYLEHHAPRGELIGAFRTGVEARLTRDLA
jgi:hypothetical protein